MRYRLYIDETGNSSLSSVEDENNRYLSLTGVIMQYDYVREVVHPELEDLKKRYFNSHPDEPVILHRKELANRKYPFQVLWNPKVAASFDAELLDRLNTWEYEVVTVSIDKLEHTRKYTVWRHDPYHYCLEVLLERYLMQLRRHKSEGDVMAEQRGGGEDKRLIDSFRRIWEVGTRFIEVEQVQQRLTSKNLKIKSKTTNVAGLQIADLLAHPSFRASLARQNGQNLPENFGGQIAALLEDSKYCRNSGGDIDGWGRKWLPSP